MLALQLLVIGLVCLSVLGESEEWSEVFNPCLQSRCPAGHVCVPIVNDLLQIPVAHCVEDETTNNDIVGEDKQQCSTYDVGASIVTCRTEAEWKQAGSNKCSLTSATATVKVHYPCHRSRSDSQPIFLQATISCCPEKVTTVQYPDTEITPVTYSNTVSIDEDVIVSPESEEKQSGEKSVHVGTWVIVMFGGCAILIGVAIITIKILHYRRSKRNSLKKPKLLFVTAYVNPSSDSLYDDEPNEVFQDGKVDLSSYITSNSNVVADTYY